MKPIYLDYAANTPVLPEVLSTYMTISQEYIANPNASHTLGRMANDRLEDASQTIASLFNVKPEELIYTSGATEANNLAIKGIAYAYRRYGKHIITSYLEHSSVTGAVMALQEEGFDIDFVDVNANGTINTNHLKELLRNDTILVSLAAVDSEVGCTQDLSAIYSLTKQLPHCIFHTDATQAIGKLHIDSSHYDMLTCTAHKFYGLNGFGLLISKDHIQLQPLIHGGISTSPYRSGTPVLAMVCAMETALSYAYQTNQMKNSFKQVSEMNAMLRSELGRYTNIAINSPANASPYILNVSLRKMKSELFVEELAKHNIFISTKSACCAVNTPSKPVYAMTKDRKLALSTLRISLSHFTTEAEISEFLSVFSEIYRNFGG